MTTHYRRLVIDTDVVSSAGGEMAQDKRAILCRDFLKMVLQTGHKVTISDAVMDEWRRHRSQFTKTWLRSMFARRKIELIEVSEDNHLRLKIEPRKKTFTRLSGRKFR